MDERYFEWIVRLVCGSRRRQYRKLLMALHRRPFEYSLDMDENRAKDGIELRYRYAYEEGLLRHCFPDMDRPCSVLEMMAALAIRCEEHIMYSPDAGDRTSVWFFDMVENLGLIHETDAQFDAQHTEETLDRLITRQYESDGAGGLFTVPNCRTDLRDVEIWYQAMWYLRSRS